MKITPRTHPRSLLAVALGLLLAGLASVPGLAGETVSLGDVLSVKTAEAAVISPDGKRVAYTVRVPRKADDEAGAAYDELHVASTTADATQPYVAGEVNVESPRWSPDGTQIAFLTKRGEKPKTQVGHPARRWRGIPGHSLEDGRARVSLAPRWAADRLRGHDTAD